MTTRDRIEDTEDFENDEKDDISVSMTSMSTKAEVEDIGFEEKHSKETSIQEETVTKSVFQASIEDSDNIEPGK